jgi:hypothetical protein
VRFVLPLVIMLAGLALARAPRVHSAEQRVPLLFHVAIDGEQPVAEQAFLAQQLRHADRIFEPLGVALSCAGVRRAPAVPARIVSREQRDALGAWLVPRVLNVFVAGSLMDVDEPGRERRGVHWRVRSDPRRHLIILSAKSGPYVLAHELGHFFGNPAHSETPGNLMSYAHTDAIPWLDAHQVARVQTSAAEMLTRGELRRRADTGCFDAALPGGEQRQAGDH